MIKKIQSLIMAVMMAVIFPILRVNGNESNSQAGTPALPNNNTPPVPPSDSDPRVSELEIQLAAKNGELNAAGSRVEELEASLAAVTAKLGETESNLKKATANYKLLIVKSNPDIIPELIAGESFEALDGSLVKARDLVNKIVSNLREQAKNTRIPPGAPQRGAGDASSLSPREKIREGINKKS